jgi:hypothetical protein
MPTTPVLLWVADIAARFARRMNPAAVGQKSLCNGTGTTAGHPLL